MQVIADRLKTVQTYIEYTETQQVVWTETVRLAKPLNKLQHLIENVGLTVTFQVPRRNHKENIYSK